MLDNLVGFSESKWAELVEAPFNMWFVYIILCEDGSLYTGYSNNVDQRLSDHKNGKGGHYTRSHKPLRLLHQETFNTQSEALKREKQIKGWSREKKIRILGLKLD